MSTSWTQPLAQVSSDFRLGYSWSGVRTPGSAEKLLCPALSLVSGSGRGSPYQREEGEALLLCSRMSPSGASVMTALQGSPPEPGPRRTTYLPGLAMKG